MCTDTFKTLKENLLSLGYDVKCFEKSSEAICFLNGEIDGETVGFGGSVTLSEMGLYDSLKEHNEVFWHYRIPDGKTAEDMRRCASSAEVYLSSVNGIAESGEIVNIDGYCNRVASIFYGHKRVYLVVGKNKIAKDYEGALYRAKNIAAPLNAKRLKLDTPCAVKGDKCYNCNSKDKICRGLSVLWAKPSSAEFCVILINEDLGY